MVAWRFSASTPSALDRWLRDWMGPTLDEPPVALPLVPDGRMFTNE
ncbi:MAG TPA: hypothetical protein VK698_13940 [Kofleriaceae bacterium]|nr:hypothetical protein [Kofleriaceae bacterium]